MLEASVAADAAMIKLAKVQTAKVPDAIRRSLLQNANMHTVWEVHKSTFQHAGKSIWRCRWHIVVGHRTASQAYPLARSAARETEIM